METDGFTVLKSRRNRGCAFSEGVTSGLDGYTSNLEPGSVSLGLHGPLELSTGGATGYSGARA